MSDTKVFQVEGVSARQIFEAFKCLENQIKSLNERVNPSTQQVEFLTRSEAAELLKVSHVTLYDWTNKGFLKSYRLGSKVYYKRAEVDAAMIEITKGGRRNGKG